MRIHYRPEIDGLRSIAVLSVLFYHAKIELNGLEFFTGGYIGVDIFFVISGYLITSIILKEIKETQNFSFILFYQRRIRRIIPALLFVIFCSLFFAWKYLLPSNLIDFSKSSLYSMFFSSNFYFYFTKLEYVALESLTQPLLHTWSLGIEEQFYIIFPLFFFLSYKFYSKKIYLFLLIIVILNLLFIQLSGNLNFSKPFIENEIKFESPSIFSNFYLISSRAWELLAGSIISILEANKKIKLENKFFNLIFLASGVILCLHAIFYFNSNTFHPSLYTLSPVLGTTLIIFFSGKNDLITRVLSSKIMVKIGLISYSLYLWHYPIFAFARTMYFELFFYQKILLIILTFLLSILTYTFIEKPFRNQNFSFKKIFFILVSLVLLISTFNIYSINEKGAKNRFSKMYNSFENYEIDNESLKKKSWINLRPNKPKFLDNLKIKVLLIGDSHSKDMFNIFYQNQNLFNEYEFTREEVLFDNKFLKKQLNILKNTENFNRSEYVIISDRFNEEKVKNLDKIIIFLKKYHKKIVILSKSNEYENYLSSYTLLDKYIYEKTKILNQKIMFDDLKKDLEKIYYKKRNKKVYEKINSQIENIAKNNNVKYLKKQDFTCNNLEKTCDVLTEDKYKIYYDYGHYTLEGAKFLGEKIYKLKWLKLN